jgi:hypothetical protein
MVIANLRSLRESIAILLIFWICVNTNALANTNMLIILIVIVHGFQPNLMVSSFVVSQARVWECKTDV